MKTQEKKSIHSFTRAGLGKAPFKCVGHFKMIHPAQRHHGEGIMHDWGIPKGWHGGTCDYCGHGIILHFQIVSSDGKRSVVGSECIEKLHDSKLSAEVRQEKRLYRQSISKKKREEAAAARLDKQRELNGGYADFEYWEATRMNREITQQRQRQMNAKAWKTIVEVLEAAKWDFGRTLAESLREGNELKGKGLEIARDMYIKASTDGARRGSRRYDDTGEKFDVLYSSPLAD